MSDFCLFLLELVKEWKDLIVSQGEMTVDLDNCAVIIEEEGVRVMSLRNRSRPGSELCRRAMGDRALLALYINARRQISDIGQVFPFDQIEAIQEQIRKYMG